jgi:hypothetical protein
MTIYNNNFINQLPGVNSVLVSNGGIGSTTSAWSVGSQNAGTLTINNGQESVITFHKDGIIETTAGKIHASDWIQIINVMKQFIMDVANDPETAEKYPYIKDMAHTWMMDKLKK